jgi:hypothetical protein
MSTIYFHAQSQHYKTHYHNYHMLSLRTGLIKGEYVLSDDHVPVSIKEYKLTSKGKQILAHLK